MTSLFLKTEAHPNIVFSMKTRSFRLRTVLSVLLAVTAVVVAGLVTWVTALRHETAAWTDDERPHALVYVHGLRGRNYPRWRRVLIDGAFGFVYGYLLPPGVECTAWSYQENDNTSIEDSARELGAWLNTDYADRRVALYGHSFGGVIVAEAAKYVDSGDERLKIVTVASPLNGALLVEMGCSLFGSERISRWFGEIALDLLPERRRGVTTVHPAHTNIVFTNPLVSTDSRVFYGDQWIDGHPRQSKIVFTEHVLSALDPRVLAATIRGMRFKSTAVDMDPNRTEYSEWLEHDRLHPQHKVTESPRYPKPDDYFIGATCAVCDKTWHWED